ncbi:MAG: patatin-like phospholipase family protein [Anaeroplasmataceae bacterium]|nr:patatin-like phospholipase family protein [Anaeroplasmataceae bacterium]
MKIGIALSGGLAKGAFQFGFLKAFLEYIPKEDIKIVSASSIGIVNSYGLCANKMKEVEKIWRTANFKNVFDVIKTCWGKHYIRKTLNELVLQEDRLEIPMYATITYLPFWLVGRYYYIDGEYNQKWKKFFRAAIAFPFLTGFPKFYKGLPTMDGGACDNIPIYPLVVEEEKLDLILCIHFDSKFILKQAWKKKDTIVLDLDASLGNDLRKNSFNFSTEILNKMLDGGYEYGHKICEKIFEYGYGNLEGIQKSVNDLYEEEFQLRMSDGTIDRLVTILNGFAQIFRGKHTIKPLVRRKKKI